MKRDTRPLYVPAPYAGYYPVAIIIVVLWSLVAGARPTAYCKAGISKPCGQVCISESKTCRKSWTTAVIGERPETAKIGYEKPKFLESVPKATK